MRCLVTARLPTDRVRQRAVGSHATAMLLVAVALSGCYRPAKGPWLRGTPEHDPPLEQMLRPEEPIEKAGLFRTREGTFFYEACLVEEPPSDYLEHYQAVIEGRGVFIRATRSNLHQVIQRLEGWWVEFRRPGRTRPFSLQCSKYRVRDAEEVRRLRNAPAVLAVQGGCLQVRLGRRHLPWTEQVIVPDEDLYDVAELPLERFPGSVLKKVPSKASERGLRTSYSVTHQYVVVGVPLPDIMHHYRAEAEKLGISLKKRDSDSYYWGGEGGPVEEIEWLKVEPTALSFGEAGPAEIVRKHSPHLLKDLPSNVLEIRVGLRMTSASAAARYWTHDDQTRRSEILEEEER